MTGLHVEIVCASPLWSAVPDIRRVAAGAARAALAAAGVTVRDGAEASVLLTDDTAVGELNRAWRGFDRPTNVLSFPAIKAPALAEPPHLGDIALAFETIRREAAAEGKTLADHTAHLVVHGVLHLLGHDHASDEQAEAMETLEVTALAKLGIADPYAGAAGLAAAAATEH